ncbi:EF-hand domain-containing protein [Pseudocolwellia sp. AS88]|jgi:Ca2+-binding EF-hand superfamily protein|uniref:EF-hand domain-containing protein n=1 Tax=Pseudocolwellia TaxID=2848177 RepID=UPI0026E9897B|nr:EF-hand domain-containing protein [Pseudocolwellia sp. AS88]MDO7085001.1 EF-hand domain-containing protein [Pseudocolwellia sp. AS88]
MNNSNLVKMTLGVAFATIATFVVNANDITPKVNEAITTTETQIDAVKELPVTEQVESAISLQQKDFSQLLSEFDADQNGALSEAELSTSDNEALKMAFKNLDVNEDSLISASEFSTF